MRGSRVWAGLLGIEHATVERVEYDEDAGLRPRTTGLLTLLALFVSRAEVEATDQPPRNYFQTRGSRG